MGDFLRTLLGLLEWLWPFRRVDPWEIGVRVALGTEVIQPRQATCVLVGERHGGGVDAALSRNTTNTEPAGPNDNGNRTTPSTVS